MTQVVLGDNEHLEAALRRFKRQVSKAGILRDMKKNRHFETPAEKRKRKAVERRHERRRMRKRDN
jgi:small subunit ribosomal protein S21